MQLVRHVMIRSRAIPNAKSHSFTSNLTIGSTSPTPPGLTDSISPDQDRPNPLSLHLLHAMFKPGLGSFVYHPTSKEQRLSGITWSTCDYPTSSRPFDSQVVRPRLDPISAPWTLPSRIRCNRQSLRWNAPQWPGDTSHLPRSHGHHVTIAPPCATSSAGH